MRAIRNVGRLELRGEEGDSLTVTYDNRGEPYREGITLSLSDGARTETAVFIENREACELRDLLNRMYPSA